jgi:hypothetical protein
MNRKGNYLFQLHAGQLSLLVFKLVLDASDFPQDLMIPHHWHWKVGQHVVIRLPGSHLEQGPLSEVPAG